MRDLVPVVMRHRLAELGELGEIEGGAKVIAGAGDDEHAVIEVVADIVERIRQLTVDAAFNGTPGHRAAIGVEGDLQDPILAMEFYVAVFVGVAGERRHGCFLLMFQMGSHGVSAGAAMLS